MLSILLACLSTSPEEPSNSERPADPDASDFDLSNLEVGLHESAPRLLAEAGAGTIVPVQQRSAPGFDERIDNAGFDTTMRRVTPEGIGSHLYSQLQVFSYDAEHMLLLEGVNESSVGFTVRRTSDLERVWQAGIGELRNPRWHPAQPTVLVDFAESDEGLFVRATDVLTGETNSLGSLPFNYVQLLGNPSNEELSRDGRWLGGMAVLANGNAEIFSFDLEAGEVVARIPFEPLFDSLCAPDAQWGMVDPDWVAASPRGNFLAVQWPTAGTERCSGLETFDIRTGEFVGRVHDSYPHGDLQILADGVTEVFVSAELRGPGEQESFVDGTPGGTDLDQSYLSIGYRTLPGPATGSQDPEFLVLTDWIYEHMSCRGPAGWCLVTTYANPANGFDDPLEDEIALVALDGSGVTRLAHHRSSGAGYWEQPRASFSSDGRYVVFDTDWGMNAPGTAVYVIDLAETP